MVIKIDEIQKFSIGRYQSNVVGLRPSRNLKTDLLSNQTLKSDLNNFIARVNAVEQHIGLIKERCTDEVLSTYLQMVYMKFENVLSTLHREITKLDKGKLMVYSSGLDLYRICTIRDMYYEGKASEFQRGTEEVKRMKYFILHHCEVLSAEYAFHLPISRCLSIVKREMLSILE